MKKQETSWKTGALFICTKCGKSISDSSVKEPREAADDLKKYLKSNLKDLGFGKEIRVMTSSCLDVCIPEVQAVTYFDGKTHRAETFTLHPENEREELLKFLTAKLDSFNGLS